MNKTLISSQPRLEIKVQVSFARFLAIVRTGDAYVLGAERVGALVEYGMRCPSPGTTTTTTTTPTVALLTVWTRGYD